MCFTVKSRLITRDHSRIRARNRSRLLFVAEKQMIIIDGQL